MKTQKTQKTVVRGMVAAAALVLAGGALPKVAQADTPGDHPHYLHALSDLRQARAYVVGRDENNVMGDEMDSLTHIDSAIHDIKGAAIDDGKNLRDHSPIDASLGHKDRLKRALTLIAAAHRDLSYEEDNSAALGWRHRAFGDVDAAYRADQRAIQADYRDDNGNRNQGRHPHYLHALSDLRAARAYVVGQDENNVMGDEMAALTHIDGAIGDIKGAAIDDGKNLHDHFPIDTSLRHKDRLKRALTLLTAAHQDLSFNEDNGAARGWRNRAFGDVDAATRAVRRAIADDHRDDRFNQ